MCASGNCLAFFSLFSPYVQSQLRNVIIMIDPAGDAQDTGKRIDNTFERGLTLQCAEQLKLVVESRHHNAQVILTRSPGDTIAPLQNANLANRLNIDLYISLSFFNESEITPRLYLYNFSYNDDFITKKNDGSFCRYDQAHLFNYAATREYAQIIPCFNTEHYKKLFDCKGCFKLPCKPLIGIKAPALKIEIGLNNKEQWQSYVEPLTLCLQPIIDKLSKDYR